jgi:hypothetical protein
LYPPSSQNSTRFSKFTLSYSGYDLHPGAQKALVLLQGGGTAVPCALSAKIQNVTVVIENPPLAEILKKHYGVEVVCQPPRAFMSQTSEQFDIIHLENWGAAIPGQSGTPVYHRCIFTIPKAPDSRWSGHHFPPFAAAPSRLPSPVGIRL